MAFTKWLCTSNMKSQFIKIVHPGGHVELHDRPLLAAEIIVRNPRCCVAQPHVFEQPWAIIAPESVLVLGHKYYVVPVSTVKKLQRHSGKNSPSAFRDTAAAKEEVVACGLFWSKKKNGVQVGRLKNSGERRGGRRDDGAGNEETSGSWTVARKRNGDEFGRRGSATKHRKSVDSWQPNLESISEAISDAEDQDTMLV